MGFTGQGDFKNPYSTCCKCHPFFNFWNNQIQSGYVSLLHSLWKNNTDSEHEVCNYGLACNFSEHGKKKTCLRCHRTKRLSARPLRGSGMCSGIISTQLVTLEVFKTWQVPEQPEVTGPALSRCWTEPPPQVPADRRDFTIRPWLYSLFSSISVDVQSSSLNGSQPKGGHRGWFECSFHVSMIIFPAWGADMNGTDASLMRRKKKSRPCFYFQSHVLSSIANLIVAH